VKFAEKKRRKRRKNAPNETRPKDSGGKGKGEKPPFHTTVAHTRKEPLIGGYGLFLCDLKKRRRGGKQNLREDEQGPVEKGGGRKFITIA